MRNREKGKFNQLSAWLNTIIDDCMSDCIEDFNVLIKDLQYCFDLNSFFSEKRESFFTNSWIHCSAKGNKMIAEKVVEILRQKGAID